MGNQGLHDAVMRDIVGGCICRSEERLQGAADAEEIGKFIDRKISGKAHIDGQPDHDTAQVKRKHGLNVPNPPIRRPDVQAEFVKSQKDPESRQDFIPFFFTPKLAEIYQG